MPDQNKNQPPLRIQGSVEVVPEGVTLLECRQVGCTIVCWGINAALAEILTTSLVDVLVNSCREALSRHIRQRG